jgi:hypothetical protein
MILCHYFCAAQLYFHLHKETLNGLLYVNWRAANFLGRASGFDLTWEAERQARILCRHAPRLVEFSEGWEDRVFGDRLREAWRATKGSPISLCHMIAKNALVLCFGFLDLVEAGIAHADLV